MMLRISFFLVLTVFINYSKAANNLPNPQKGECNEFYFYEFANNRIYVTKEVDSVIGKYMLTGEISITKYCSGNCELDSFSKPYYCGFDGRFVRFDYIESSFYDKETGIWKIEVLTNCCEKGSQNAVFLLTLIRTKKGNYKFKSFEYHYSQL